MLTEQPEGVIIIKMNLCSERMKNMAKTAATTSTEENKLKALENAIAQIEKAYGKGAVMKLGDNTHLNVETFPSGSLGCQNGYA